MIIKRVKAILAYVFGRIFIFFWVMCAKMDFSSAFNTLTSMADNLRRMEQQQDIQENYNKVMRE
jgi:hypothetical protein